MDSEIFLKNLFTNEGILEIIEVSTESGFGYIIPHIPPP